MPAPYARHVTGREDEVAILQDFLDACETAAGALVIQGDPGIGKSTVLERAVELAASAGRRVLRAGPTESEADVSFGVLGDLLEQVPTNVLQCLPPPQSRAIRVALLVEDPGPAPPTARAVALAFRAVLSLLSGSMTGQGDGSGVVVAVDDAQWIDAPSLRVLTYAARRLGDEPIGLLLTVRSSAGHRRQVMELAAAWPPGQPRTIVLGPLTLGELHHVIRDQLGIVLPRPLLVRVARLSAGNPLFALEIARLLARLDHWPGPAEDLPVPHDVTSALMKQVRMLPAAARRALLLASAASNPTQDLVHQLAGERARRGLERAASLGLVLVQDGVISFRHPLLASAVYGAAADSERRRIHRTLGEHLRDVEQRARHLALAARGPDEQVARVLDEAARLAHERGAPDAAAELHELACRLTPADQATALWARRTLLGRELSRAGDGKRAILVLDELLTMMPAGLDRARVLGLLAKLRFEADNAREAVTLGERGVAEAVDDPRLRAEIHAVTALSCDFDMRLRAKHARAALRLVSSLADADPVIQTSALLAYCNSQLNVGRGLRRRLLMRAIEFEERADHPVITLRPSFNMGEWLKVTDDLEGARPWLERSARQAEEEDEGSLAHVLLALGELEYMVGRWQAAARCFGRAIDAGRRNDQPSRIAGTLAVWATLHAARGHPQLAAACIDESRSIAERCRDPVVSLWVTMQAGLVAHLTDDSETAVRLLTAAHAEDDRQGVREPGFRRYESELVESLIMSGRLPEAESALTAALEMATAVDRPSSIAAALRAQALLRAAQGQHDQAIDAVRRALHAHERVAMPFERARTLLVAGGIHRRRREKRAAADALEAARAGFRQVGAEAFAARTADELSRIGLRRSAEADLTATERRIAELAAAGMTNGEISARMFVTTRTVETHLTHVYRKLGIRFRSQLGVRLAGSPADSR